MGEEVEGRWAGVGRAPDLLTVSQTALLMQLGRSTTYALVRRFVETGGVEGIPALLVGGQYRIPRARLEAMTGGPITWPPAPRQRTPRRRGLGSDGGEEAVAVSTVAQTDLDVDADDSTDVDTGGDTTASIDSEAATSTPVALASHGKASVADRTSGTLDELWPQQLLAFEG